MNIPIETDILFRYLGQAEYKIKLYEETMTQQAQQISILEKERDELKKKWEKFQGIKKEEDEKK